MTEVSGGFNLDANSEVTGSWWSDDGSFEGTWEARADDSTYRTADDGINEGSWIVDDGS